MLHASAVRLDEGLLLFIGDSGAGKSTLAGNFHQMGNPAISDDCVWIKEGRNQIVAVPSYDGLRLWEDSLDVLFSSERNISTMAHYSTKKRVSLNESDTLMRRKGCHILSVVVLSPPRHPASDYGIMLDPVPRREAFIEIANQTFQLDSYDYNERSPQMQTLGSLLTTVPTFRLSVPHDYALLPTVRRRILDAVLVA
jgi:energy-coupling factor transporter ATP-binding protein EcfA2